MGEQLGRAATKKKKIPFHERAFDIFMFVALFILPPLSAYLIISASLSDK